MRLFICYILFILSGFVKAQNSTVQLPNGITVQDNLNRNDSKNNILQKGESIANKIKNNLFIQVSINKKKVVVGEPILATYLLCTRLESNSKLLSPPEFTGCSVIEMTTENLYATIDTINGKTYKTHLIRRVQLLPLQEGNLQLGIATVESNIPFINTDVSGKPVVKNERVIVSNSPMEITVLPLPTKNKPIDFSGAIGEFTIQASVAKQNDSVNSNNILQITIKGVGNFGTVLCPTIQWPKGIEAFETETSEQLNKLHFPVEGRKIFRIPFTCLQKGKISIPSIGFTFFNPTSQAYEKIASEPIHLLVDKELEKVAIEQLSSEVSNTKYIWIIGIIAILVLFGLLYFFKMNEKQAYTNDTIEKEIHIPTNSLPNKENILDINELIDALNYETTDEKFVQKLKSITSELFNQQKNEAKKSMLTELIEECNVALYTPNTIIDRTGLLEKIKACL